MPTRRQFVTAAGSALVALAGCPEGNDTDGNRQTTVPSATATRSRTEPGTDTDRETATPVTDESDRDWEPDWSIETGADHLVALTRDGESLYATLSHGDSSAIAAVDPDDGGFEWRTPFEGDAVTSSHLDQSNARDKWSVTPADGTLYVVTGAVDDYEWSALHAVDPTTGEELWSFRRERELAVAGVRDGTVVAGGLEFFVPDSTHDTPDEPLTTVVYGLDAATGQVRWERSYTAVSAATTYAGGVAVGERDRIVGTSLDGTEQWRVGTAQPRALLALDGSVVAAVADGDWSTMRAFDPDGTERWTRFRTADSFLVHDGVLYALGESTGALATDGTVRWEASGHGQWPLVAPDGETLYARAGIGMDSVDAFDLTRGTRRFRYETPSNNGWPAGATDGLVVAEAITPEEADFTSLLAVDETTGELRGVYRPADTVFDVAGVGETAYAAIGDELLAFGPPE
ncbi:outer membrane protein assembly factor BamB family protein [Haloarcula halophila]|uniref:outer membrane protein assembly factor BamB family protein n=1 Tax=Haloarcula TaxID=2237 RepID=UPI0023E38BFE|nr:PQQ-binding-like beta-propeller repeat protein [Halomicroarcula sp. DFY41]